MLAIEQYRQTELELEKLTAYLEALKHDPDLAKELAFDAALVEFLDQHSMNKQKLQVFLKSDQSLDFSKKPVAKKPGANKGQAKATRDSHPEPAKTFRNPYTGMVLTVKRLSHGTYKAWVEEHGEETVQSWLQA